MIVLTEHHMSGSIYEDIFVILEHPDFKGYIHKFYEFINS